MGTGEEGGGGGEGDTHDGVCMPSSLAIGLTMPGRRDMQGISPARLRFQRWYQLRY